MSRPISLLSVVLLAGVVSMTGCVAQDKYDSLLQANRSLEEQLVSAEEEAQVAQNNLEATREQLTRLRSSHQELDRKYRRLNDEFTSLARDNEQFMRRISRLEIGPLPQQIEQDLAALTAKYPDRLTFDRQRGMLRFASDLTFDLGSAMLRNDAAETVDALADILQSDAAQQFEVEIVGHTDNLKPSRPSTLERHPTNMHLSVHRAISVRDALVGSGVTPKRIQVAGYGAYRPIVANGPRGAAQNRRVEIYLRPMTEPMEPTPSSEQQSEGESVASPSSGNIEPLK